MRFKKILLTGVSLASTSILLVGCASSAPQRMPDDSTAQTQSKKKTIALDLARGKISQSSGLMSIPVFIKNTGTNSTVINSQNFTLEIQGHKFKPLKITGESSDFHLDFDTGNTYNNTISFYLGTTLKKNELKYVKLYYTMDNGKKVKASVLSTETNQNDLKVSNAQNLTDIGTYYKDILSYTKKIKDATKNDNEIPSVRNTFSDPNYDRFKMWVVIPKKDSKNAVIKVLNQTSTDISIPFDNIEVSDKDNDETRVQASYRNYTLVVPHGKTAMITLPLENEIDSKNGPYTAKFRTKDTNSSFFSTKDALYPVETVFSDNGNDISKLFTLTPDQYTSKQIEWSKPKLNFQDNTLTITAQLKDYFAMRFDPKNFNLVGYNSDSTIKDKELAIAASPKTIKSGDPVDIVIKFKDLSFLKDCSNIDLKYKQKLITKVR
ncbi:hypothetical protein [Lactobacillus taiwanensis]|mgnify:CR=1 FL=1|uniref:hypothetical protein n=1 Tax=Lactobacillus taiwanensis TaxID=508451 RepID=UPI001AEBFC1F|nr:hypothetical protein [Lactobacillus taiwanensis]QTQ40860.1 hypothetical protein H1A07_09280 [Lactobacillus taiwanensis]